MARVIIHGPTNVTMLAGIFKAYIIMHPNVTLAELNEIFPKKVTKSVFVIKDVFEDSDDFNYKLADGTICRFNLNSTALLQDNFAGTAQLVQQYGIETVKEKTESGNRYDLEFVKIPTKIIIHSMFNTSTKFCSVYQAYIEMHPDTTLEELIDAFPFEYCRGTFLEGASVYSDRENLVLTNGQHIFYKGKGDLRAKSDNFFEFIKKYNIEVAIEKPANGGEFQFEYFYEPVDDGKTRLEVKPGKLVSTLQEEFKAAFGANLRAYYMTEKFELRKADPNNTLNQIAAAGGCKEGIVTADENTVVSDFEKQFRDLGILVQISNSLDSRLVEKFVTLGVAGK